MRLCTRITLIAGLCVIVMGCAKAKLTSMDNGTPTQPSPASSSEPEGRPIVVSGLVETLLTDPDGNIKIGIAPHAQMYTLLRSDKNFEKWLSMLKEAKDHKEQIKLTVRAYSGRIELVEMQK